MSKFDLEWTIGIFDNFIGKLKLNKGRSSSIVDNGSFYFFFVVVVVCERKMIVERSFLSAYFIGLGEWAFWTMMWQTNFDEVNKSFHWVEEFF